MAKVVLATGVEQLDREIARAMAANKVEVAGECYYLEGILPFCEQAHAGVVVISPELPGSVSLEETVLALRHSPRDIRCVLLPGPEDLEESYALASRVLATGAGVYDFIFSSPATKGSTVSVGQVVERVLYPASFADAEAALTRSRGARPASKNNGGERRGAEAALLANADGCESARRGPIAARIRRRLLQAPGLARLLGGQGQGQGRDHHSPDDHEGAIAGEETKRGEPGAGDGAKEDVGGAISDGARSGAKGALLLLGPQSSSLLTELVALGWEVTGDPATRTDAAVVDADLLSTLKLGCPAIGFSDRISSWFQHSDGTLVVANRMLIPALIASYARQDVDTLGQAPAGHKKPDSTPKRGCGFVYAFYSGAQGSQGKTVLAVNAGALLARTKRGIRVCIVDLDTDKAGLTLLLGYSEANLPRSDVADCVEKMAANAVQGPAGSSVIPAPIFTRKPGWFPTPEQVRWLISALTNDYDYVLLDFGARLASPPVLEALGMSDQIYIVSTPMRTALSAIARFRGRELMETESGKITAVINRVGMRGGLSPRDAATLLGFGDHFEVPEDPAVAVAENDALDYKPYQPPVCNKKSLIGPALASVLEATRKRAGPNGRRT
jgi:MinD-like ATPase involved in chromosome partitioning or flagellar assembly